MTYPDWMDSAYCAQTDPELFFPERGQETTDAAKKICRECPVTTLCAEYALSAKVGAHWVVGVWGGTSTKDRVDLRHRKRLRLIA